MMVKLNDVFKWKGAITQVLWINESQRSIGFITTGTGKCEHCGKPISETWNVIESSNQWKEGAKPVKTIEI